MRLTMSSSVDGNHNNHNMPGCVYSEKSRERLGITSKGTCRQHPSVPLLFPNISCRSCCQSKQQQVDETTTNSNDVVREDNNNNDIYNNNPPIYEMLDSIWERLQQVQEWNHNDSSCSSELELLKHSIVAKDALIESLQETIRQQKRVIKEEVRFIKKLAWDRRRRNHHKSCEETSTTGSVSLEKEKHDDNAAATSQKQQDDNATTTSNATPPVKEKDSYTPDSHTHETEKDSLHAQDKSGSAAQERGKCDGENSSNDDGFIMIRRMPSADEASAVDDASAVFDDAGDASAVRDDAMHTRTTPSCGDHVPSEPSNNNHRYQEEAPNDGRDENKRRHPRRHQERFPPPQYADENDNTFVVPVLQVEQDEQNHRISQVTWNNGLTCSVLHQNHNGGSPITMRTDDDHDHDNEQQQDRDIMWNNNNDAATRQPAEAPLYGTSMAQGDLWFSQRTNHNVTPPEGDRVPSRFAEQHFRNEQNGPPPPPQEADRVPSRFAEQYFRNEQNAPPPQAPDRVPSRFAEQYFEQNAPPPPPEGVPSSRNAEQQYYRRDDPATHYTSFSPLRLRKDILAAHQDVAFYPKPSEVERLQHDESSMGRESMRLRPHEANTMTTNRHQHQGFHGGGQRPFGDEGRSMTRQQQQGRPDARKKTVANGSMAAVQSVEYVSRAIPTATAKSHGSRETPPQQQQEPPQEQPPFKQEENELDLVCSSEDSSIFLERASRDRFPQLRASKRPAETRQEEQQGQQASSRFPPPSRGTSNLTTGSLSIASSTVPEQAIANFANVESSDDEVYNNDVEVVREKKLQDRSGDRGLYSGPISLQFGLPHGEGQMRYDSGRIYKGTWSHGRWNGRGRLWNPNGDFYEGDFVEDARHGKGLYEWSTGNRYKGEFRDDVRHGQGTFEFANGNVYKGQFERGNFNGFGEYKFGGGTGLYRGKWKSCRFEGKGMLRYNPSRMYTGEFAGGCAHGQGTEVRSDGTVKQGLWINGNFVRAAKR